MAIRTGLTALSRSRYRLRRFSRTPLGSRKFGITRFVQVQNQFLAGFDLFDIFNFVPVGYVLPGKVVAAGDLPGVVSRLRDIGVYRVEPDSAGFTDNTTGLLGRETLESVSD